MTYKVKKIKGGKKLSLMSKNNIKTMIQKRNLRFFLPTDIVFIYCINSKDIYEARCLIYDKLQKPEEELDLQVDTSFEVLDRYFTFRLSFFSIQSDIYIQSEMFFDIAQRNGREKEYIRLLIVRKEDSDQIKNYTNIFTENGKRTTDTFNSR